jgi:hypothetical protein
VSDQKRKVRQSQFWKLHWMLELPTISPALSSMYVKIDWCENENKKNKYLAFFLRKPENSED